MGIVLNNCILLLWNKRLLICVVLWKLQLFTDYVNETVLLSVRARECVVMRMCCRYFDRHSDVEKLWKDYSGCITIPRAIFI